MRAIWGALLLVGCGGADASALFGADRSQPLERDSGAGGAALERPAKASAASDAGVGGSLVQTGSGGASGDTAIGLGGATHDQDDAGAGGTIGAGGAVAAGGSAPAAGGHPKASGGSTGSGGALGTGGKACTTVKHCVYPRVEDDCPCDNVCPAACAASSTIERLPFINGQTSEQLHCGGSCAANATGDCCVPKATGAGGSAGAAGSGGAPAAGGLSGSGGVPSCGAGCAAGELCVQYGNGPGMVCVTPSVVGGCWPQEQLLTSAWADPPVGCCDKQPVGCEVPYYGCHWMRDSADETWCGACSATDGRGDWKCGPKVR